MRPAKLIVMTESGGQLQFQPGAHLVAQRRELDHAVDQCLQRIRRGEHPGDVERERVDVKEEAGRRGTGGRLLPGAPQNVKAADQLADEVAAMANTPGGGALLVGIEDKTGDLLGTELDPEWLRHQIYQRIDVAPDVVVREEEGIRLLVIYVAEAREPVEDTGDRLRWRVGAASVAVDRGQWWLHRQGRAGWDPFSAPSRMRIEHATEGALAVAREYVSRRDERLVDEVEYRSGRSTDLLQRLGLLTAEGFLTEVGALLFCPAARPWLTWTRLDVEGGDVLAYVEYGDGLSLLEQIARIEGELEAANDIVTLSGEFSERSVRKLPPRAAREAVLNGVIHRDWNRHDPTNVRWVEHDHTLTVVSPGGFVGGVTSQNLLTQRFSRSPALSDAMLALGLVDKQGIGVDRMYREMVTLGHRPPQILEEPGPRVRSRLVGGDPVVPVMRLTSRLRPHARRRDVQVALVVHTLLHEPFATVKRMASVLQRTEREAVEALEIAARCVVDGAPVVERYKDVWILSEAARRAVRGTGQPTVDLHRRGVLWFVEPPKDDVSKIVTEWLRAHDRITSGDYAALTGRSIAGARGALERLEGDLLERGDGAGRNAHFVRT